MFVFVEFVAKRALIYFQTGIDRLFFFYDHLSL